MRHVLQNHNATFLAGADEGVVIIAEAIIAAKRQHADLIKRRWVKHTAQVFINIIEFQLIASFFIGAKNGFAGVHRNICDPARVLQHNIFQTVIQTAAARHRKCQIPVWRTNSLKISVLRDLTRFVIKHSTYFFHRRVLLNLKNATSIGKPRVHCNTIIVEG